MVKNTFYLDKKNTFYLDKVYNSNLTEKNNRRSSRVKQRDVRDN